MFSPFRSIVSFVTIFALVFLTLTLSIPAQKADSDNSQSKILAPSAVLYSNSNITTGTANGLSGANTSSIFSGGTSFGSNVNAAVSFSLGDRFTLTSASTISSIVFYPYSTSTYPNPPAASPFTGVTMKIWNGQPGNGGTIVATSSTLASSSWTGVYRVQTTTLTNAQRPVFSVAATFPNTPLTAGNYWATFSITGIVAPGSTGSCFAPPVMNADGTNPTAYPNTGVSAAVQSSDSEATWIAAVDGTTPLFIPITVNGTITTAAGVDVSGRVMTPDGRGIRSTNVIMTDQSGHGRNVLTGPNGVFVSTTSKPDKTYVVRVGSRRFSFTPRIIQITDSIADLDFVAGK